MRYCIARPAAYYRTMTDRATTRPQNPSKGFTKPAHWNNDPAPKPAPIVDEADREALSPTRYGDWVRDGIAVDF